MSFYPSAPAAHRSGFLIDGIVSNKDLNIEFFAEEEYRVIPSPTTFIKVVNYNSNVYLISYNSNRVYRFDGRDFTSDSGMYIPQASANCSVFATDDIFVYSNSNDGATTSVYYQGVITDYEWKQAPSLDYPFQSAILYYKDTIHVFGGNSIDDKNAIKHSIYKIGDSKWTEVEELPFSCWHSVTLIGDYLYFLGEFGMWVYDGTDFRSLGDIPFEIQNSISSITVYDKILCIGSDGTLNVFDTKTETWGQVSGFSREIDTYSSGRLFSYNNGIFALGDSSDVFKVCRFGYKEV